MFGALAFLYLAKTIHDAAFAAACHGWQQDAARQNADFQAAAREIAEHPGTIDGECVDLTEQRRLPSP